MIQKNLKKSHEKGHEQKNLTKAGTMERPIEKITLMEIVQLITRIKLGKEAGLSEVNTQIITGVVGLE